MDWLQTAILVLLALAMLGAALALVRRRRLREGYAVLWVCAAVVILLLLLLPGVMGAVGRLIGADPNHPVTMLLAALAALLVAVAMHYAVVITRQADRLEELERKVALLKEEMNRVESASREAPPRAAEPKPRPPALRT
jgi:hypothetical protein